MAEYEDLLPPRRPHRVEVVAEAEDLRPLLDGERVVDDDAKCPRTGGRDPSEDPLAERVSTPFASRKESMERRPVSTARDIRRHEGGRHRVRSLGENPTAEENDDTNETRTCKRGPEAVFPDRTQPAIVHARGSLLENVW